MLEVSAFSAEAKHIKDLNIAQTSKAVKTESPWSHFDCFSETAVAQNHGKILAEMFFFLYWVKIKWKSSQDQLLASSLLVSRVNGSQCYTETQKRIQTLKRFYITDTGRGLSKQTTFKSRNTFGSFLTWNRYKNIEKLHSF